MNDILPLQKRLENKKALVTGAFRGIGREITALFLAGGAEVWGLGSKERDDTFDLSESENQKLHRITADLSELDDIDRIIESVSASAGGFDILVNNAGITKDNLSFRMSLEQWRKVLDINLGAAFLVTRTVARSMIHKQSGSIINMSSVTGIHGNGGQANYSASKAGIIGMTKSLAQEYAGRGVRVNAIAPGFIDTDMTAILPAEIKQKMLSRIPLGRTGTSKDIANAVMFLASDESAYITGQVLPVDGGMFM